MWLYRADQVAQVHTAINPLSDEQFLNGQQIQFTAIYKYCLLFTVSLHCCMQQSGYPQHSSIAVFLSLLEHRLCRAVTDHLDQGVQQLPQGEEGDTKEEAERASEL